MRFICTLFLFVFLLGLNFNLVAQNIFTITGNGTPGFSGDMGPAIDAIIDTPQGAVLDPAGNIYFVDSDNYRIRQIGDIALSVFEDRQKITNSIIYPNPSTGIFER